MGDYNHLVPLLDTISPYLGSAEVRPLPEPEEGTPLREEDSVLSGWGATTLIRGSFSSGIQNVWAVQRMVVDMRLVDPVTPWTLLRAAMESFGLAAWLLSGETREERLTRTLKVWAYDMKERGNYELDSGIMPTGPKAKDGFTRQAEMVTLASELELPTKSIDGKLWISGYLKEVAPAVGCEPNAMIATWRIASGFAHGRFWPYLNALQPTHVLAQQRGRLVRFESDPSKLKDLSEQCHALASYTVRRYRELAKRQEDVETS